MPSIGPRWDLKCLANSIPIGFFFQNLRCPASGWGQGGGEREEEEETMEEIVKLLHCHKKATFWSSVAMIYPLYSLKTQQEKKKNKQTFH